MSWKDEKRDNKEPIHPKYSFLQPLLAAQPKWRNTAIDLLAGTTGGLFQLVVGHPLDTIKVRLQTQPIDKSGRGLVYRGVIDCVKKVWRHEGLLGFFKGMASPMLGVAGLNAILF